MMVKLNNVTTDRLVHFFRDVDLESSSRPEFALEYFDSSCWVDEPKWPALFLLRCAVRLHHIWASWGVKHGVRNVLGPRPAVCFSELSLKRLIELTCFNEARDEPVTYYAITFPKVILQRAGVARAIQSSDLEFSLESCEAMREVGGDEYLIANHQISLSGLSVSSKLPEWRWAYRGDYDKVIEKIEDNGFTSGCKIPGLNFAIKKLSGMGIIVKSEEDARKVRYDVVTLVDKHKVLPNHFDHILVLEKIPKNMNLASDSELEQAVVGAMIDISECFNTTEADAQASLNDFMSRLFYLEKNTARGEVKEWGGCWLCFYENDHPYVRGLIKAGRVRVTSSGLYIASLDEVDRGRDLRERQNLVKVLGDELQRDYGVQTDYFSVLKSYEPDEMPSYRGKIPLESPYMNTGAE